MTVNFKIIKCLPATYLDCFDELFYLNVINLKHELTIDVGSYNSDFFMTMLVHIILMLGYIIIALFASVAIPGVFSEISVLGARVIGGGIFLLGTQLHVILFVQANKENVINRLMLLHQDFQVYLDKLEKYKNDTIAIRGELRSNKNDFNKEIITQISILKTLINQVVDEPNKPKQKNFIKSLEVISHMDNLSVNKEPDKVLGARNFALDGKTADLYLQPIVSLRNRDVIHYEAYLGIRDGKSEVIFQSEFIKLAKDPQVSVTLDNLLLFKCIQVIRRLGTRKSNMLFFCNISSLSLNDKYFFPKFVNFMLDNKGLASRLILQFTQKDVRKQSPSVWGSLATLSKCGYKFSMGDVDLFNNNLTELAAKNFHFVKIKTGMLPAESIDRNNITKAYKKQNIELILEKIMSEQGLSEILDCGVSAGQGKLFGRPLPSGEFTRKL